MTAKRKGKKRKSRFVSDEVEAGSRQHRPRIKRPHAAQEYQDKGQTEIAANLVRDLKPRYQLAVLGPRNRR